jgi:hypothetical protein
MNSALLPKALALCLVVTAITSTAQSLSDAELGLRIMANRQQGNCVTCHQVSVLRDAKGIDGAKVFAEFHEELKKVAAGR